VARIAAAAFLKATMVAKTTWQRVGVAEHRGRGRWGDGGRRLGLCYKTLYLVTISRRVPMK
jgi:hypothetical protein